MLREQLPSARRRMIGTVLVSAIACGLGFAAWAAQPSRVAAPPAPPEAPPPPAPEAPPATPVRPALAPPRYPAYAVEHNLGGRVVLIVDVSADGRVRNAVIERSEPKGIFDEAALAAVRNWKFEPATEDGKPVASQVRVPIDFQLDPAVPDRPGQ